MLSDRAFLYSIYLKNIEMQDITVDFTFKFFKEVSISGVEN